MAGPWVYAELLTSEFGTILFDAGSATGHAQSGDHIAVMNHLGRYGWEAYAVYTDTVATRYYLKKPARRRESP